MLCKPAMRQALAPPSNLYCHLPHSKACTLAAGIDASGLPSDLECHHLVVNQWQDLEAPQNVCIISIPSVFDKSLAPPGKHTIHAYVAGGPAQLYVHISLNLGRIWDAASLLGGLRPAIDLMMLISALQPGSTLPQTCCGLTLTCKGPHASVGQRFSRAAWAQHVCGLSWSQVSSFSV